MRFRDSIFKDIEISEVENKIIEDPNFQRLRYIRQGGFAFLVYQSANGTRFEHSVGTMKITKDISSNIFGEVNEELAITGLLHDIGHPPFSHQSEPISKKYLKKSHEDLGYDIIKNSSISDIISNSTLSLNKILEYFSGKNEGKLITGPIGSDRIDYLLRDSYNTGVALGVIDYPRLKSTLTYINNEPAIYTNGIVNVESFFIARYFMYQSVYFHHASAIAEAMFLKVADQAVEDGYINAEEFVHMRDYEALYKLSKFKGSTLINDILNRNLLKRAFYKEIKNKDDESLILKLEGYIEQSGINHDDYIIKIIKFTGGNDEVSIINRNKEKVGTLKEYSPLFNNLSTLLKEKKILLVAARSNLTDKLNKIVSDYLQTE